jgi:hypothetical protein
MLWKPETQEGLWQDIIKDKYPRGVNVFPLFQIKCHSFIQKWPKLRIEMCLDTSLSIQNLTEVVTLNLERRK